MVQDRAIGQLQWWTNRKSYMVYRTALFCNYLERHQTQISRSCHCLMLNICKMATNTTIVTTKGEQEAVPKLSVSFSISLSDL